MKTIGLQKTNDKVSGRVRVPGSKSISNRALIMAELAGKETVLHRLSDADDTVLLNKHLNYVRSCGSSGIPTIFDVENAGTVARFMTAYLVAHVGEWLVTGCTRMRERPIGALVEGLVALGASIRYCSKEGFLPLHIKGKEIHGGEIEIDTSVSSQFVTAILLVGPYLEDGLRINFKGEIVSEPYIRMTVEMMKTFGAHVELFADHVVVAPHPYHVIEYTIESDWTSAAYWYEVAALSKEADIFVEGLYADSIQGDAVLPEIYDQLGVSTTFENGGIRLKRKGKAAKTFSYDFKACPDLALSVICTCAGLGISCSFTGVNHLKYKESNRLERLRDELSKLGVGFEVGEDSCSLAFNGKPLLPLTFDSYHDHRLAMSFAPMVLIYPELELLDAEVVGKSYPSFWEEFQKLSIARLKEMKID